MTSSDATMARGALLAEWRIQVRRAYLNTAGLRWLRARLTDTEFASDPDAAALLSNVEAQIATAELLDAFGDSYRLPPTPPY